MRHQAILYELATGRVRAVLDPERDTTPEEVVALLPAEAGHATLAYAKRGRERLPHESPADYAKNAGDRLHEWQAAVSAHTGLIPDGLHPEVEAHVRSVLKR